MSSLQKAVQSTISYAKFFDFELTTSELHHWLISNKTYSLSSVSKNSNLSTIPSRTRQKRALLAHKKLQVLNSVLPLLRLIPTIKLITVTGSLAMQNAKLNDDIDIMIITSSETLWITRPFVILLLSLFSKRRLPTTKDKHAKNTICANLWLDANALQVPKSKQNLYTAHEVLQIQPVLNREEVYQQFLRKNSWTKKYLANAYQSLVIPTKPAKIRPSSFFTWLNHICFVAQYLYMRDKLTNEHVTPHSAYFHPRTIEPKV